jgi:hypothetical protein
MPTENWGDHDYYFSASGHQLQIGYEVKVTTQAEPAEDATTAEARIYWQTPLVSPSNSPDETKPLMKNGSGMLTLDLSTYDPKAKSPMLVQFVFSKDFSAGPKSGSTETNDRTMLGVVLAVPDVAAIGVKKSDGTFVREAHAKVGDAVELQVTEWGVHLYDDPTGATFQGGIPADQSTPDTARFPAGYDADVKWFVDGVQKGTGTTLTYTIPEDAKGKELKVEAYRFADLKLKATASDPGRRASAKVGVVQLVVVGLTPKGVRTKAPHAKVAPGSTKRFQVVANPEGVLKAGAVKWTIAGGKATIGPDGKSSAEEVPGEEVHVTGVTQSASDDDQTLKPTFTSNLSGNTFEVEHKLTVKPAFTADFYSHTAGETVKQYVNLPVAPSKPHGNKVKLTLGPKEDKGVADVAARKGAEGDLIFVQVKLGADNSKRNSPKPGLWIDGKAVAAETDKVTFKGQVALKADGAPVDVELELGHAGKDTCEVKIGATDACGDATLNFETLRKVFVQATVPAGLTEPAYGDATTALAAVGIEFDKYKTEAIADTFEAGAWLDASMIESGKTGKALVIGTHNIAKFTPKFTAQADKKPALHVLYCHYQLDAETTEHDGSYAVIGTSKIMWPPDSTTEVRGYKLAGDQINGSGLVFEKAIHDSAKDGVVKVSWRSRTDATKSGDVPRDHIALNQVKYGNAVFVKLPSAAATLVDGGDTLNLRIQVYWAKGWYNGWSTRDNHNVIKGGRPDKGINGTIVHELGHAVGQVVKTAPPGLEVTAPAKLHAWWYDNARGHSGTHCAFGIDQATYDDATKKLNTAHASSKCTCIMYGAGTDVRNAAMTFCDTCKPFVKAYQVTRVTA